MLLLNSPVTTGQKSLICYLKKNFQNYVGVDRAIESMLVSRVDTLDTQYMMGSVELHHYHHHYQHQQEVRPRNQYRDKWRLWKLHGAANRLELSTILCEVLQCS